MKQWFLENIPLIITTLFGSGSFFAYTTEKKKRNIEEKQLGADALSKMQEAYDKFTMDALSKYDALSKEVAELKKALESVTLQLESEKQNYSSLKESYDKLKMSYNNLKKEFDLYKKTHT